MEWYQVVCIALLAMSFAVSAVKHGSPRSGSHSIWGSLFGVAIWVTLLHFGGFWA